jgi:sugar phosphate permease
MGNFDKWGKSMKKHRWSIVILIAIGVVVNYFDRINMSIAMPLLQKEFDLTV